MENFYQAMGTNPARLSRHLLNWIKMGPEEPAEAKTGSYLEATVGQKMTAGFAFCSKFHRGFFHKKQEGGCSGAVRWHVRETVPTESPHAPRATGVDGVNHLPGAGPKTILLDGLYIWEELICQYLLASGTSCAGLHPCGYQRIRAKQ